MLDRWYRAVRIKMTIRRFWTLPRHPAYKYEYLSGYALLTPRPKSYGAILTLEHRAVPEQTGPTGEVRLRPFVAADWAGLPELFAGAFHQVPPFSALPERLADRAARDCLDRTREG